MGGEHVPDRACHLADILVYRDSHPYYAISMSKARYPAKKARRQSAGVSERIRSWRAPITQLVVCVSTG